MSRSMVVAIVLVLVTVTSVAAVVAVNTNDGAVNPDGAVVIMLEALVSGDFGAALAALPPAERSALAPSLPELIGHLGRLGVTPASSLGAAFGPGHDLRIEDLRSSSVLLNHDVARVTVTNGRVVGVMGDVPLSASARTLFGEATGRSLPATGERIDLDLAARPTSLLTIREGGGWHVSLFETIVDLVRDPAGPVPAWTVGSFAVGSSTPEEVVTDLFKAASDLDPGRALSIVEPDEQRALYEAGPLFVPSMRRAAGRWVEDEGFGFPPPKVDVLATGSGEQREVTVTRFDGRWRDRTEQVRAYYDGTCLTFEHRVPDDEGSGNPSMLTHCDGDVTTAINPAVAGHRLESVTVWAGLGRAFPTFVVRERNGRWFLSPSRTVLRTLNEILAGLSPDDMPAFFDRAFEVVRSSRPNVPPATTP